MDKKEAEIENSGNHYVFTQLSDMFGEMVKTDVIIEICVKHNWQRKLTYIHYV